MTLHLAPLACQDDAARTATTDRATQADLVLNLAIYDAIDLIREGNVTFARHRLARALASAGRILGSREVGL